ncbi:MAG: hypothetical protein M1486_04495 [Gammaproteobacteria bacterium]|nr:hypothetical protein [Gammaproteobacteria bacterium]
MPRVKKLAVAALSIFLIVSVHAKDHIKIAYDSSVLLPGSRVVAGNLSQNEFFITGNEAPIAAPKTVVAQAAPVSNIPVPTQTAKKLNVYKSVQLAFAKEVKTAKSFNHHTVKPMAPAIRFAARERRPVKKIAIVSSRPAKSLHVVALKSARKRNLAPRLRNEDYADKITLALKHAIKAEKHSATHVVASAVNKKQLRAANKKTHVSHKTTYYRFTKVTPVKAHLPRVAAKAQTHHLSIAKR